MDKRDMKQMDLKTFSEYYGISASTLKLWIHMKSFPAYKQGHKWYVDIDEYRVWRQREHNVSYKYA